MQTGDIFRMYFRDLGEANAAGENPVRCPFPHKKDGMEYMEQTPSAHVNLMKGVFNCKTCRALGKFHEGGMSEVDFYAKANGISYTEALKMLEMFGKAKKSNWSQNVSNLLSSPVWMEIVQDTLKFTRETVETLQLGFSGDGLQFPVTLYGELLDIRTYNPDGKPKITGQKGSKPLLFPFDLWVNDDRPTLLCEGEKDTAIARQMGFNALTVTAGSGTFPKILRNYFKGRDVYIAYDCDDAGTSGAEIVAHNLLDVADSVRIVELGLEESEDVHDFFIKYNRTADDLFQKMQQAEIFTPEWSQRVKNRINPLVDLWDATKGRYSGKELTSRVVISGRFETPMETPTVVEWQCRAYDPESVVCKGCRFRQAHKDEPYLWTLDASNSEQLLKLVDYTVREAHVDANLRNFVRMPEECPGFSRTIRCRKDVKKVMLVPDAQSIIQDDPMSEFKTAQLTAYILEQDNGIDVVDGQRYRINYKRYPHPTQAQMMVLVVHEVEPSDSAVDAFRMSPELKDKLKVFQGNPKEKMPEIAEMARKIIGPHIRPMLVYAVDMMFHSPLQFNFHGKRLQRGYPELAIVGDTRTGKTDAATILGQHYGVGTYTDLKHASVAGLMGGAEQTPMGGYKVKWGTIVMNHRGLVVLDEFSGVKTEVMAQLTSVRSSQRARVGKIAKGEAPAFTRLLWISNPRVHSDGQNWPLVRYPSGVMVMQELFGSHEDIARFDAVLLVADEGVYVSPLEEVDIEPYPQELYQQLVYWSWSRRPDQIIFDAEVERLIDERGKLLNAKYKTNIKIFGPEAWKKIARLAVAIACRLFSCDDTGECVIVREEHVDFACRFLVDCYDNKIFRLKEYAESQRLYNETDDNVNMIVAGLIRQHPSVIRTLYTTTETNLRNLQAISGLEKLPFDHLMNTLHSYYLIEWHKEKIQPSYRFRQAMDVAMAVSKKTHLQPLSTGG